MGAYAQSTDVTANSAVPVTNTVLRPNTSPARAIVSSAQAKASRYAVGIQTCWVPDASRSRAIVGNATVTAVTSIICIVTASRQAPSVSHDPRRGSVIPC